MSAVLQKTPKEELRAVAGDLFQIMIVVHQIQDDEKPWTKVALGRW